MKKFKESPNTAVFTTRYIIEGKSPILFVSHDSDGSWQFHGKENKLKEGDYKLVALEEILSIDNSVMDVADLREGYEAFRNKKDGKWIIKQSEDEG